MAAATAASRSTMATRQVGPSAVSQTQTQTQTRIIQPVLRLRAASDASPGQRSPKRIQWASDVVDNEGLGRKSSKVCCIYHAPRPIDESSDESSSDDSSSDESGDDGAARPVGGKRGGKRPAHGHDHDDNCSHGKGKARKRPRSPNAYEKVPKIKESGGRGEALGKLS